MIIIIRALSPEKKEIKKGKGQKKERPNKKEKAEKREKKKKKEKKREGAMLLSFFHTCASK